MPDALLDEIFEELAYEDPKCERCERPMTSQRHWAKASKDEKWELWLEGYESPGHHKARHCAPCSFKKGPLEDDELKIRDDRRFRVLTYKRLREEFPDDTQAQLGARMGITGGGLSRNIQNWKRRGWL